jgi:hypothetical protein
MATDKPKSLDGPVDLDDIVLNENINLVKLEEERECMRLGEEATKRIEAKKEPICTTIELSPKIKEGDEVFYYNPINRYYGTEIKVKVVRIQERYCCERTKATKGTEYTLQVIPDTRSYKEEKKEDKGTKVEDKKKVKELKVWLPEKPFPGFFIFYYPQLGQKPKNKP